MGGLGSIYLRLIGSRIRSQLAYPFSFWLMVVGQMFLTFSDFLMIAILFTHIDALEGWSLAQVGVLYGISTISLRLGDMFFGGVEQVPVFIRAGSFDGFLVRPLGSLFQVITADFFVHQVGGLVQGSAVLVVALSRAGIHWTPARVAMLVVTLASGFAIYGAIFVVANGVAFWLIDSREFANAFTYGGGMVGQYPLTVLGAWLRRLFVFVFPVAFASYFPVLYLLGRTDPMGFPSGVRFASPLVAAAAWLFAGRFWTSAVRHYRSTGS